MKKFHWKIILIASTLFLLAPYAGEFGNLKVKADETVQTEISSSSSEQASAVESSQSASTEQGQSSTELSPVPSQTAQSSSAQEQTKTSTPSKQSQSGTLSDMIDQMFPPTPALTKANPNTTIEYVNGGIKFNNKFYTEAEFVKYIEKNFVPNPQVQFHVDASGKIVIDSQTRIASTMNWPNIGEVAAKGATAIGSLGGISILASAGTALLIGGGLTVGYDLLFPHKVGGDIKATPAMIAAMAKNEQEKRSGPLDKPNRKKQGREINEGKKQKAGWKGNPNKNSNKSMKKHTPGKEHRK